MSSRIVLYSAQICPWAHRARIALAASKAKHEIVEIDLKNKPEWYKPEVNPAGKVPAISYGAPQDSPVEKPPVGTFILPESSLNVQFVASLFPHIDYKDPITRAKSSLLAFQYESTVSKAWSQLAMQSSGDDESIEGFLNAIKGVIPYIDDALLSTDEYGVGDILIAPFVTRVFLFLETEAGSFKEGTGKKVLDMLSSPEYSKFVAYARKLQQWDAVRSTIDNDELARKWKGLVAKK